MEESFQFVLSLLTDTQLMNMESKVWNKMTEGDGYQPYGYDDNTLKLTNPVQYRALLQVRKEQKNRLGTN
jgi:hypothetical protein